MIDKALLEKMLAKVAEVEKELSQPAAAANSSRYRQLGREHAALKKMEARAQRYLALGREIEGHRELIAAEDADPEIRKMATDELAALEASCAAAEKDLMVALLPPDPQADRNAIVEIRAGTGGDEAALFAGDLFRMYGHYAERRGWKIGIVDASASDLGGYKEVVFSVEGEGAYGVLQFESGGHRVQRIPVTEAAGRIHTSAATVAVFPEAEPEDAIELKPEELRIDIFCASGPGGQGVNTTYSAVRVTHLPSGLVAQSQDERSQHRNKEKAIAVLKARMLDARRRQEEERMGKTRRSLTGSGDRSERVRTYNFPQNRVTDHRINLTLYSLNRAIEGEIDELLKALGEYDLALRLEAAKAAAGA